MPDEGSTHSAGTNPDPLPTGRESGQLKRKNTPYIALTAAGVFLLCVLLLVVVRPGPDLVFKEIPYVFVGGGAVLLVGYLWSSHQIKIRPVAKEIYTKWYPGFVLALWALAVAFCIVSLLTPALYQLAWAIPIIALVVHAAVHRALIYAEGADRADKCDQNKG